MTISISRPGACDAQLWFQDIHDLIVNRHLRSVMTELQDVDVADSLIVFMFLILFRVTGQGDSQIRSSLVILKLQAKRIPIRISGYTFSWPDHSRYERTDLHPIAERHFFYTR